MSLYLDFSELLASPMRTGIQRVTAELCKYVPPNSVVPVRLNGDRYVKLPSALVPAIGEYFRDGGESALATIARLSSEGRSAVELSSADTVVVPEIFGEPRAEFFRALPAQQFARCRFIVYDLLPFTHPEYFPPDMTVTMGGYYQTIRKASGCAFISEYTRDAYCRRLKRMATSQGVVLPLGCDSLGPRVKQPSLNRRLTFSVLGTIEPRKNHELILEAFEPLLSSIEGLTLAFIGKVGWVDPLFADRVQKRSAANSGFRLYAAPDDGAIRTYVQESRATIYLSAAEGYGLPPVESLWLGTPVIASATIPSLSRLGCAGIERVEPLTVANLRRTIFAFLDRSYANKKIQETPSLDLPTWESFSEAVLRWCAMPITN